MTPADRRGTTTLEFAVVGSAFTALLLLSIELGWQLVIDAALAAGARVASRFGTTGATVPSGMTPPPASRADAIQRLVITASGGVLLPTRLAVSEMTYPNWSAIGQTGAGTAGAGAAGQIVQYTVRYTQPWLTPLAAALAGSSAMTHTATVVVLNEPFPSS